MIYLADSRGTINGVVTAYMQGYTNVLDGAGQLYAVSQESVEMNEYWISRGATGGILVRRLPAQVLQDPMPIALGQEWTGPVLAVGTRVAIDGEWTVVDEDGPLVIAPDVPGRYEVVIDDPRFMTSRFVLEVLP